MQVMLMRLMSKGEYVIVPKGTKFTGSGKLGLNRKEQKLCILAHQIQKSLRRGKGQRPFATPFKCLGQALGMLISLATSSASNHVASCEC